MSSQENIETVKENLLENAKFSIQLGAEDYKLAQRDGKRNISAIRNIFAGVLLLYKYKLILASPKDKPYIYITAINSKTTKKIYSGVFGQEIPTNTVDVHNIKANLKDRGIEIDESLLNLVNMVRNNIEHFYHIEKDGKKSDLSGLVNSCFRLISEFFDNYLSCELNDNLQNFLEHEVHQIFLQNKEIYEARLERSRNTFLESYFQNDGCFMHRFVSILQCPNCHSDFVKRKNGEYPDFIFECDYCNSEFSQDEFFGITHQQIGESGDPREECQECGAWEVVFDFCLSCGMERKTLSLAEDDLH